MVILLTNTFPSPPGRAPRRVVRQLRQLQMQCKRKRQRRVQASGSSERLEARLPYLEEALARVLELRIRPPHRPPGH